VSAFVYTDGLGFLAATGALAAAAAAIRRGPTPARLAGLTAAAAAAALTRAPGLVLVGFAGAAAAAGVLLHGRRPGARRLLAAAAGGVVAGLAGGSALWFYLRNRSLYGSLTGTAYNQDLFGFVPQDHALDLLTSPAYALRLYDGLWVWTRFSLPRVPTLPALVAVPRVVGLLVLAGLALTATRRLRLRPPGGPVAGMQPATAAAGRLGRGGRSQRLDRPALCAWGLLLAWPVAVFAMVATYDGNGGHTHPRYLFPGLAVLAVVAALGLDGCRRAPGAVDRRGDPGAARADRRGLGGVPHRAAGPAAHRPRRPCRRRRAPAGGRGRPSGVAAARAGRRGAADRGRAARPRARPLPRRRRGPCRGGRHRRRRRRPGRRGPRPSGGPRRGSPDLGAAAQLTNLMLSGYR
jgi:hypothetical protein